MSSSKSICIFFSIFLIGSLAVQAQSLTQTIFGNITAKGSLDPLAGVKIELIANEQSILCTSQPDGSFTLPNVPVGRQSIIIYHTGYKDKLIENMLVTSGKQIFLEIELEEEIVSLDEIVIYAERDKNKPLNAMTLAGGRMFSIEETQRFAAAFNDPARMASSYPGVVQANDVNNDIVIRGNSPNGLLWRLNGVDIPNPNHFSSVGTSGGGISALSAQVLGNSDFLNGAFNAEYGNALSGVFDLNFRKGNNQKREYTVQFGFIGADISVEGPFKKDYKGSYLLNYRYSTLNLIKSLGVDIDDNSKFQDVSFHIYLPTNKKGSYSLFGLGGLSSQNEDRTLLDIITGSGTVRFKNLSSSSTGVLGLSHLKSLGKKMNLKSTMAVTGNQIALSNENTRGVNPSNLKINEKNNYAENKFSISTVLSIFTGKTDNFIKTGITSSFLQYSLLEGKVSPGTMTIKNTIDERGSTVVFRGFAEYLMHISKNITINSGLHFSHLGLNKSTTIEPRAALLFPLTPKKTFSIAYGLHSQLQPTGTYFIKIKNQDGIEYKPNTDLGFSRAHHFIAALNYTLDPYHNIKMEAYYQYLYNIPVSPFVESKESMLNITEGILAEPLINKGKGKNKGVEITVERFLKNSFYYILAGSWYESKYKTTDEIWRNTRFNGNYTFSFTGGNEFSIKRSKSYLGLNLKTTLLGGLRTTPINIVASQKKGSVVYYNDNAFQNKLPDYHRLDFRISYRNNYKRFSLITAIDIQNVLNKENTAQEFYNPINKQIEYAKQNGIIPVFSIKAEF